jgi:NADH-quinone oxidoreductase subunit A
MTALMPISTLLGDMLPDPNYAWAPVVLLVVMGIGFAVANIGLSIIVGPSRQGPGKSTTYESGMIPIGDTKKRFNVRFYIVAMIFLVFDVDIIFFYPFASIFPGMVVKDHVIAGAMLIEIIIFIAFLFVAYFYAWGKGVFRWD